MGHNALKRAEQFWFIVTVLGQFVFVYYMVFLYGGAAAHGNGFVLHTGNIRDTDLVGSILLEVHIVLAIILTLGGPFLFIPKIRKNFPKGHSKLGRLYGSLALVFCISGIFLVVTRGTIGGVYMTTGITINALLIVGSVLLVIKHAIARNTSNHRKWALRLFVLMSGVWFFRIGFILWMVLNQGPVGHLDNFQGPFDIFISFGSYLIPLFLLEIYFWVKERTESIGHLIMAGVLGISTLSIGVGSIFTTILMWLPKL